MIGIGSHCSTKLCIIRGYASQNGGTFQKATKYLQNAVSNRFYHKTLETGPYFFPGSEISEIRHKSDKKSAWKTPILNYASQNGVLVFGLLQFYKAPHWLLWPTGSQRNYKVLIWHPSCKLKSPPLINMTQKLKVMPPRMVVFKNMSAFFIDGFYTLSWTVTIRIIWIHF